MLPKFNRRSFLCSAIVFAAFLSCARANSAENLPQVVFRGETEREAFSHVMIFIKKLSWFKKYGYKVTLPEHKTFKKLYENPEEASKIGEDSLKKIFATEIYDESIFEKPLKMVCKTAGIVNKALQKLSKLEKNWGFKLKSKYEVLLAAYGHSGCYWWEQDIGKILVLTRSYKISKKEVIAATFVHEIVHIGIEENIVQKYKLDQWQKERVVDLICSLYLKDVLPDYKPNPLNEKNGDRRIDEFVDKEAIVQDLPSAIEKFKARFPTV